MRPIALAAFAVLTWGCAIPLGPRPHTGVPIPPAIAWSGVMALPPGTRVKVSLSFGSTRQGRIVAVTADALTLDGAIPQQQIPRTLIARVSRQVAPLGSSYDHAFRAVRVFRRAAQGAVAAGSVYALGAMYDAADRGTTVQSNRVALAAALGGGVGALVGWFGTDWEIVYDVPRYSATRWRPL